MTITEQLTQVVTGWKPWGCLPSAVSVVSSNGCFFLSVSYAENCGQEPLILAPVYTDRYVAERRAATLNKTLLTLWDKA